MFYKFHSKSPWLKRVLVPFWVLQIGFMLALISVLVWLSAYSVSITNIVLLLVSAVCSVLSVAEIILFATTRLHPFTYLNLQLVKTVMWFLLFVLAAVDTARVQSEMEADGNQGYSLGNATGYFYLLWFGEPLVLFITFLGSLIYASVIYHRHRHAKSRFLRSLEDKELFPVIPFAADDELPRFVNGHPAPQALEKSTSSCCNMNEPPPAPPAAVYPAEKKDEAVEVTVLKELGGNWEVYELPATKSVRNSRRGVGGLKGGGTVR